MNYLVGENRNQMIALEQLVAPDSWARVIDSQMGNDTGNSRNGTFPKKIQTEHGESIIQILRDRNSDFDPVVVPKHESRGVSIEKLVISLYAKGMSVSDIEDELCDIYEITLSTNAISIITNKVMQAALEWQNRPLDRLYMVVWMDGIVFKVREPGKIINKTVYLCVGLTHRGHKEITICTTIVMLNYILLNAYCLKVCKTTNAFINNP